MNLSLNWLKSHINLPADKSNEQLAYDLTMSTVEVESIKTSAENLENIVVGKILEIKKHPNADKLKIVMVDVGKKEPVKIICGGENLVEKILVAVALPGAKVRWHGEGDLIEMKEAEIRGEKSFGMICASNEIGLQDLIPCGERDIANFSAFKNITPGQLLSEILDSSQDAVIEIDNKSLTNRPDLWNHYGVARELSAIYKTKLMDLDLAKVKYGKDEKLIVEIGDKENCYRYLGCIVKNIKIEPSPDWLVKRLESVGSRAINNIVDITNYVMQDVGQPMHAFDLKKISNKKNEANIKIRKSKKNEKMQTLDGKEYELDKNMLVIADEKNPIALAGIMGGTSSEIDELTTDIVLESASFNATSIRKTSQALNIRTDSSNRFEKALHPNFAEIGMLRALKFIKEICPSAQIGVIVENYPNKKEFDKKIEINIEHEYIEKKIGQEFDKKEILGICNNLGFIVEAHRGASKDKPEYKIKVPWWRSTGDISIKEDIVEEIIRIYGYEKLKDKSEFVEFKKPNYQFEFDFENKLKNYLATGCGMSEVFNYPWAEKKILDKLKISTENLITISNPPAEANRFLQNSLIPNLYKNILDNMRYFSDFKIFELARVYKSGEGKIDGDDKLPVQPKMLAGAVVGTNEKLFLEAKGILEQLTTNNLQLTISQKPCLNILNSEKCLEVSVNNKKIGWLGETQEKIKNKTVVLFEINFDLFSKVYASTFLVSAKKYEQLPQFPSIVRDLAFELDWGIKWQEIKEKIKDIDELIKNIEFLSEFDLGDKKSLAFRTTYQTDKTLTDAEVEVIENKIIKLLSDKFNAELRK